MRSFSVFILLMVTGLLLGCYPEGGLRHLAYRVSLVEDGKTTEAELRSVMGPPDRIRDTASGRVLVFSDLRRSRGRRVPLLGGYIGSESHEQVRCTVRDDGVVAHCEYSEEIRE